MLMFEVKMNKILSAGGVGYALAFLALCKIGFV